MTSDPEFTEHDLGDAWDEHSADRPLNDTEKAVCSDYAEFHRRLALANEEEGPDNMLRVGALAVDDRWRMAVNLLYSYRGDLKLALDCFMVAMGEGRSIGLHTAADISRKHRLDDSQKQAATKCIQYFQQRLALPPMPGQRSEEGRAAMHGARQDQL